MCASPQADLQKTITGLEKNRALPFYWRRPRFRHPEDTASTTEHREYLRLASDSYARARPSRQNPYPDRKRAPTGIDYPGEQTPAPSALCRVLESSTDETMGALEALSVIWRENQEAVTNSKTKTAAIRPLQGTNAAAPNQPPAPKRERGSSNTPGSTSEDNAQRLRGWPPFHRGEAQCPTPRVFR